MAKIVEVNNLVFSYEKEAKILDDVSFSVEEGSYVTLIGHNGSGKSTLAKLLAGLLEKNSGSIKIFDKELDEKTIDEIREKIAIVFQNPDNQFIGSTVKEDIAFGLENRRIPRKDMDEIIHRVAEKVGVEKYLDKEPSQLSGGQKQRVAIGGVLALNPSLIIFDEATAMLDPKGKRRILELIRTMRKDNPSLTVISITHDLDEAYGSDYVIALYKGKIALQGTPKEIFKNKEELEKISLELPFFVSLKNEFIRKGVDVEDCYDIDSLVRYLCQSK